MENLITQIKALGTGAIALILALTLVSLGALSWTNVHAAVENTRHNLAGLDPNAPGPNTFSGTASVCVFCHTPHGGSTTAAVPLWNRTLNDPANFTTYASLNSATIEGATAPVGSVSIACLSCHDGTQAMDVVLNEPGSGLDDATYSAGVWTGSPNPTGAALIGEDLSNDHPIGIQYGGGGVTATNLSGNDPDFNATQTQDLNGTQVWWVDVTGGTAGTREKTDMLLYTRSVAGIDAGALQPFVECASCHDPHTENALFLRTANTGSAVCLACHSK